jgi:hypothetical protein
MVIFMAAFKRFDGIQRVYEDLVQDGAPKIAKLPYKWLISMVYGRYNELVNGGFILVYKPTFTSLGGPIL